MSDLPESEPDVRTRVLQHLREAMAGGLALGAAVVSAAQDGPPMVCDPLPPPLIRCEIGTLDELGQRLRPHARWQGDGAERLLHLFIGSWNSGIEFGDPAIEGGKLVPAKSRAGSVSDFAIAPAPGARRIEAAIPVPCRGPKAVLKVRMDLDAKADAVAVTVTSAGDESQARGPHR